MRILGAVKNNICNHLRPPYKNKNKPLKKANCYFLSALNTI